MGRGRVFKLRSQKWMAGRWFYLLVVMSGLKSRIVYCDSVQRPGLLNC